MRQQPGCTDMIVVSQSINSHLRSPWKFSIFVSFSNSSLFFRFLAILLINKQQNLFSFSFISFIVSLITWVLIFSHNTIDPRPQISDLGVNTIFPRSCALNSPRSNTLEEELSTVLTHHWTSRISLTRVFSTLWKSSTYHWLVDAFSVSLFAFSVTDNWNWDLH